MKNILLVNSLAFLMLAQPTIKPEYTNTYRHDVSSEALAKGEEKRSQVIPAVAMAILLVLTLIFYGLSDKK